MRKPVSIVFPKIHAWDTCWRGKIFSSIWWLGIVFSFIFFWFSVAVSIYPSIFLHPLSHCQLASISIVEAGFRRKVQVCVVSISSSSSYFFFVFLGLHLQHMEVPRRGVELELQLLATATATATQDLSRICDLHYSSRRCQILTPLSEAGDWTCVFIMDPSQICFYPATMGTPVPPLSTSFPLLSSLPLGPPTVELEQEQEGTDSRGCTWPEIQPS